MEELSHRFKYILLYSNSGLPAVIPPAHVQTHARNLGGSGGGDTGNMRRGYGEHDGWTGWEVDGRRLALKINSEMKSAELSVGWCVSLERKVSSESNVGSITGVSTTVTGAPKKM